MDPSQYLSSLANLKSVDHIKSQFTLSFAHAKKFDIKFIKLRINVEKGLCFASVLPRDVLEYYVTTFNRLQIKMEIPWPEDISIFLMDQNQFNGIGLNTDLLSGDKILEKVISLLMILS